MSVGGMVPPQGNALRALGLELESIPLAVATSLLTGLIFFGSSVLVKRRSGIKKVFRRDIRKWDRHREWKFATSGSSGALFMAAYALAYRETDPFMASLVAVIGLTLFIFTKWRKLESWERALAFASTVCVIGATALNLETIERPSAFGATCLLATTIFAIGVSWQFQTLAEIASIPTVTIRAAATISTASGFLTAIVLHCVLALLNANPFLPTNPWPTEPDKLWMYTCGIAGIWIIPVGTFASKKLGKIYPVVMVSGNLLCGMMISLTTSLVAAAKIPQLVACAVLAISGVALNINARVRQGFTKLFGTPHHPVG